MNGTNVIYGVAEAKEPIKNKTMIPYPLNLDDIRKECLKYNLTELSYETNIEKSGLCLFRQGKVGLSGKNIIKLINYLYRKGVLPND